MGFFKAYDMRGTFGADFDLDLVRRVGAALPRVAAARAGSPPGRALRVLVGRDCRTTSPAVRDALVAGLAAAGAEVWDLGLCTTPMVYFFTAERGFDLSVMVTASHNPPTDNGLKVSVRGALPMGGDTGLKDVERLALSAPAPAPVAAPAPVRALDGLPGYVDWLRAHTCLYAPGAPSAPRFAVDCSNGMASLFARDLFPGATILNGELDGSFPAHSPNPLKAEAREQLAERVRAEGLDCGVVFDGDADRCMFVDERGRFVQPDYLVPVVASRFPPSAADGPRPVVIHDVRTSRGAVEALREAGFEPRMVPVGHAFAKVKLREYDAVCGGELAGHYYFRDFHCCDSGAFAALKVLEAVAAAKARGVSFSELMRPIGGRYANSGELNFKVADKDAAIARVLAAAARLGRETGRSEMDGVRLEFAEGWISVRKSNTEPFLRLIAECDGPGRLREWLEALRGAIGAVP